MAATTVPPLRKMPSPLQSRPALGREAVAGTPGRSGSSHPPLSLGRLSPRAQVPETQDAAIARVRPASPRTSGDPLLQQDVVRAVSPRVRQAGEIRVASPESARTMRPSQPHASSSTPLAEAASLLRVGPRQSLRPAAGSSTSIASQTTSPASLSGPANGQPVGSNASGPVNKSALMAGSSLGQLVAKVQASSQEREQELQQQLRRMQSERQELEDLLHRSSEELHQLISVVSHLHELQKGGGEPETPQPGPERPRPQGKPPFFWQPSQEYAGEFEVSGDYGEVVTKMGDFEDQGWVIPVGGAWRLLRGGVYRWTLRVERKCPSRPQLQLGVHGMNHSQPWRLVTTSRCSWSRDDEPWQDRVGGDRLIDEGSYVHVEVDLRGLQTRYGSMALAINDEPYERFFEDIPLGTPYPLIPVVSMGGDRSRVRLCPSY